jgi:hypothetical protein
MLISRISEIKRNCNSANKNNMKDGLENSYNNSNINGMMMKNKTTASYAQIIKDRAKVNTDRGDMGNNYMNNINNNFNNNNNTI